MNDTLLLTVDEALARLRISRGSLYKLIGSGELPTILIGRRRLVPVPALEEFIAQRLTKKISAMRLGLIED